MSDRVISLVCGAWCKECPNCAYQYAREEVGQSRCPECSTYRGCMEVNCQKHCGANCKNCMACEYKYPKDSDLEKCPNCGRSRKCPNSKVTNRPTCRMHGGSRKQPRGAAHKGFKGGIYSKVMPKDVRRNFQSIESDPTLLVMRREIALLTHRTEELLARIYDQKEEDAPVASAERWRSTRTAWKGYLRAISMDDTEAVSDYKEQLNELIDGGLADYDAWEEIERIAERIRKLKAAESKRLVEQHQIYTAEQVMAYMAAAGDAVIEEMGLLKELLMQLVADKGKLDEVTQQYFNAVAERLERISALRNESPSPVGGHAADSSERRLLTTSLSD